MPTRRLGKTGDFFLEILWTGPDWDGLAGLGWAWQTVAQIRTGQYNALPSPVPSQDSQDPGLEESCACPPFSLAFDVGYFC